MQNTYLQYNMIVNTDDVIEFTLFLFCFGFFFFFFYVYYDCKLVIKNLLQKKYIYICI